MKKYSELSKKEQEALDAQIGRSRRPMGNYNSKLRSWDDILMDEYISIHGLNPCFRAEYFKTTGFDAYRVDRSVNRLISSFFDKLFTAFTVKNLIILMAIVVGITYFVVSILNLLNSF